MIAETGKGDTGRGAGREIGATRDAIGHGLARGQGRRIWAKRGADIGLGITNIGGEMVGKIVVETGLQMTARQSVRGIDTEGGGVGRHTRDQREGLIEDSSSLSFIITRRYRYIPLLSATTLLTSALSFP